MEETTNTNVGQVPQGKGMGIAGFVISLVGLVLYFVIAGLVTAQIMSAGMQTAMGTKVSVSYGLVLFWLVVCILGLVLSIMGMIKLGRTGGKRGLAITGMVLGIIATILTVLLVAGVSSANKKLEESAGVLQNIGSDVKAGFEQALDSLKSDINKETPADSTAH
jgi:hypothetical protein